MHFEVNSQDFTRNILFVNWVLDAVEKNPKNRRTNHDESGKNKIQDGSQSHDWILQESSYRMGFCLLFLGSHFSTQTIVMYIIRWFSLFPKPLLRWSFRNPREKSEGVQAAGRWMTIPIDQLIQPVFLGLFSISISKNQNSRASFPQNFSAILAGSPT